MDLTQAQSWVLIIAAVGAAVVSIISALKSKQNGQKLDIIHQLTNSNLTAVKADLEIARKDITFLKEFISKNTKPPEPPLEPEPTFVAKIELAPDHPTPYPATS